MRSCLRKNSILGMSSVLVKLAPAVSNVTQVTTSSAETFSPSAALKLQYSVEHIIHY